jgi:hypothetical protein
MKRSPDERHKYIHENFTDMFWHYYWHYLLWLRKTSVSVKTYQLTFYVYILETSFFSLRFPPFYSYFCVIGTSVLSLPMWSQRKDIKHAVKMILHNCSNTRWNRPQSAAVPSWQHFCIWLVPFDKSQ